MARGKDGRFAAAQVQGGGDFWGGASGRWAGERLLEALKAGKTLSPAELRTATTLRKDEWVAFDEALVEEGLIRLRGVADLLAAGLTVPVANAMGKTVLEYEKVTDMNPAGVSLSGVPRTEDDRVEFELDAVPLPITHKDFDLNLRTLVASRTRGESLDTTQARVAGRKCAERQEQMLFQGGPTFGGRPIYGYLTHPDRNQMTWTAGGAWNAVGKTGAQIIDDVLAMIAAAEADRYFGPYWLYTPSNFNLVLETDFKAASDKTIRKRISEIDRIASIKTVDQLTASHVILVQATRDVTALVTGETLQSVQWDIEGGFIIKFKAFEINVPLIRSDASNRSGVQHMR